jgi:gliding motility-associated-like protein
LSNTSIANPTANPTATITYQLIVSSSSCIDTDYVTITVKPPITANAGSDVALCPGQSTVLNGSGGSSYTWFPATALSNANIAKPIAKPKAPIAYALTVSDGYCFDSDTMNVSFLSSVKADAGNDVTICPGDSSILDGSGNGSYTWFPSTGLSNTSIANPIVYPAKTTTYAFVVSDSYCKDTDYVNVNIVLSPECPTYYTFYAPDAFTPNSDDINNQFIPVGSGWDNSTFEMRIFDRWGKQVYYTNDIEKPWNGTIANEIAQQDVYVWKVSVRDVEHKMHNYIGRVSIVR